VELGRRRGRRGTPTVIVVPVARLSSSERAGLADRSFAYIDARGVRRLPIHDESHVRNALARFGQIRFEDDAARERARARLLNAARRYRIVPIGFIANELEVAQRASVLPAELPRGFVTMLMTDVEGSTALVQQLGSRFGALIDDVWAAHRVAVADAGGLEVEARADEFFAVFEAPRAAINAAVAMQRAFGGRSFVDGTAVRVRVGIHSGYPTMTAGNYVGVDVNTASRITALGHGGQIVASAATREAVQATTGRGVRFLALGPHQLRGFAKPMALFQIASKGLPARFPPLRT
jgi:class 3 adenylate cyclase